MKRQRVILVLTALLLAAGITALALYAEPGADRAAAGGTEWQLYGVVARFRREGNNAAFFRCLFLFSCSFHRSFCKRRLLRDQCVFKRKTTGRKGHYAMGGHIGTQRRRWKSFLALQARNCGRKNRTGTPFWRR